jgi:serine/threonine protein kinase
MFDVKGGTLLNYTLNHKINLFQAIKFGKDIAAGMSHLHSEGFLHCDLAAR